MSEFVVKEGVVKIVSGEAGVYVVHMRLEKILLRARYSKWLP